MLAAPSSVLSAAVTILAVLFVFYTGVPVGGARSKYNVPAPQMSGHPMFERAYRVQLNTLEQFAIFLPLLWVATAYFSLIGWLPAAFGLLWIVGRIIYMQSYMRDPGSRSMGFLITLLGSLGLLVMSVIGIAMAWMATTAA